MPPPWLLGTVPWHLFATLDGLLPYSMNSPPVSKQNCSSVQVTHFNSIAISITIAHLFGSACNCNKKETIGSITWTAVFHPSVNTVKSISHSHYVYFLLQTLGCISVNWTNCITDQIPARKSKSLEKSAQICQASSRLFVTLFVDLLPELIWL